MSSTTNPSNQSDRLAAIAKQLVDVANVEIESKAQKQLSADLEALKTSFEKGLSTLADSSSKSLSTEIKTLNQKFDNLQAELKKLEVAQETTNSLLKAQAQRQKLEFAIAHCCDHRSFMYQHPK